VPKKWSYESFIGASLTPDFFDRLLKGAPDIGSLAAEMPKFNAKVMNTFAALCCAVSPRVIGDSIVDLRQQEASNTEAIVSLVHGGNFVTPRGDTVRVPDSIAERDMSNFFTEGRPPQRLRAGCFVSSRGARGTPDVDLQGSEFEHFGYQKLDLTEEICKVLSVVPEQLQVRPNGNALVSTFLWGLGGEASIVLVETGRLIFWSKVAAEKLDLVGMMAEWRSVGPPGTGQVLGFHATNGRAAVHILKNQGLLLPTLLHGTTDNLSATFPWAAFSEKTLTPQHVWWKGS
jgi:hypothetical protein